MSDSVLRIRIFISEFFGEFIPIYALIPLLFAEHGKLLSLQVGSLLAAWQILIVVFEIPTGVVADRFGRRISMQAGKFMRMISFPIWLLFPNYLGFLIGIVFLALGDALLSGSLEAYTYDELRDKKLYNKLRQQTVSIHLAAFTMAGFVAYILGANYTYILWASVGMSIIAYLCSYLLPVDINHSPEELSIKRIVSNSFIEIHKKHSTLIHFLRAAIILSVMIMFIEQINLFYSDTGISSKTVALLMTIGNLVTFVILWLSHLYERWTRNYQNLLLVALVLLLGVSVYLTHSSMFQITAVFIFVRMLRLSNIHISNDLQHAVSSKSRATIASLASFVGKIVAALSMIIIGLVSQTSSDIRRPLFIFGFVTILLLITTYIPKKQALV